MDATKQKAELIENMLSHGMTLDQVKTAVHRMAEQVREGREREKRALDWRAAIALPMLVGAGTGIGAGYVASDMTDPPTDHPDDIKKIEKIKALQHAAEQLRLRRAASMRQHVAPPRYSPV